MLITFTFQSKAENYADWPAYGQTAQKDVDYSINADKTSYTILTTKGLAWVAWVTNNSKITSDDFPAKAGFEGCTLTLGKDLDISGTDLGITNVSWIPIGYGTAWDRINPFKGLFNGWGHLVKGLTIAADALYGTGLFGCLENAKIRNLGVELSEGGINITRVGGNIGGVAGYLKKSSIENCYVTGEGAITVVSNTGGTSNIGGIAGNSSSSSVTNCYSTIDIKASGEGGSDIGGIAQSGTITNCYSTSELTGKNVRGIGSAMGSCLAFNPSIRTTTDYARVGGSNATNYASAGMKVYKVNEQIIPPVHQKNGTDCYLTNNLSFLGDAYDLSGDNLPRLKMLNEDGTYSPWPTNQPADQLLKSTYLPLPGSWKDVYEAKVSKDDNPDVDVRLETTASGDIYHVRTAIGLSWINYVVRTNTAYRGYNNDPLLPEKKGFEDCTIILENNIDFAANGMEELDWLPIGYNGSEAMSGNTWVSTADFKGIFDGNFHTISNMKIKKLGDETCSVTNIYLGLFGYTRNGQIKNLTVQGSIKLDASSLPAGCGSSSTYVGGIAGCMGVNGSIINCISNISIEIADDTRLYYVGGITGFNGAYIDATSPGRSSLENVYSTGAIKVAAKSVHAGGITADNKGDVLNCYSTSDIEATGTVTGYATYAGGLVGYNYANSATLQNGFSTGSVLSTNNFNNAATAGGICGWNGETIKSCIALNRPVTNDKATVSSKFTGRIAGYSSGTSLQTNYSSSLITLQESGGTIAIPKTDKETTKINGADTYLNTYKDQLSEAWSEAWAFTSDGNLPQLKKKRDDGTYTDWNNSGQPELVASDYLCEGYIATFTDPQSGGTFSLAISDNKNQESTLTSGNPVQTKSIVIINATPSSGYQPVLGYPKAYQTDKKEVTVSVITTIEGKRVFIMPNFPVTVEMKYEQIPTNDTRMKSVSYQINNTAEVTLPDFNNAKTEYNIVLPATTSGSVTLTGITMNGSTQNTNVSLTDGKGTGTITVTSGNATQTYTFHFVVAAENTQIVTIPTTVEGGNISIYYLDGTTKVFVKSGEAIAKGIELFVIATPLPGYTFTEYIGTSGAQSNSVTVGDSPLTLSAKFTKMSDGKPEEKGTPAIAPEGKPESMPDEPIVIIPDDAALPSNTELSELRLVKDDNIAPANQEEVKKQVLAAGIEETGNLQILEISLVKVTTTIASAGDISTTVVPVQPNGKVKVYMPYPIGTNKEYIFTIVHLQSSGIVQVYKSKPDESKGELPLENSDKGLLFEVTSFSPFGIAWTTKSDPTPPPYIPTYYHVTLPVTEGVTFNPQAGNYVVEEGYNFSFSLTLQEGYQMFSKPVIRTDRDDETILPRESDGKYVIRNINSDINIRIEGIVKDSDTPTGNANIQSGIRIQTGKNMLLLQFDIPRQVSIFTLAGQAIHCSEATAGDNRYTLSPGLYLVCIDNKAFKVVIH